MSKVKYRYNEESLSYERIKTSLKDIVKRVMFVVGISLVIGVVYFFVLSSFFETPKERNLVHELNKLTFNYSLIEQRVNQMQNVLKDMEQRDDNIYRTVFELDPIPKSIRQAGFGGVNRYEALNGYDNSALMIDITQKVDKLTKAMYIQSKSYDELINGVKSHEMFLSSRPAIQPVENKYLKHVASGFGMRFHPIRHVWRMHKGMDFAVDIGTKIYATGDGKVIAASWTNGFGNRVEIDHGFGYKTIYAHMSKFSVAVGEEVKRGQVIGLSGNSGESKGPHLHYEVHKNGNVVNPISYYHNDLTPEEFALMKKMAESGEVYE